MDHDDDHGVVSGIGCLRSKKRSNRVHNSAAHKVPIYGVSKDSGNPDTSKVTQHSKTSDTSDGHPTSAPTPTLISATEVIHTQLQANLITAEADQSSSSANNIIEESPTQFLLEPSVLFPTTGPLLGSKEMEKYLPKRQAIVQITTWNMGSLPLPHENQLIKLFDHDDNEFIPKVIDMHVIGIQECWPDIDTWELVLQTSLGNGYGLFQSLSLGTLHLSIFIRRDLLWFTTEPIDTTQSVRAGRLFKTKGSTGIAFGFFGSKLLFINAHLSAGSLDSYATQRVEEMRKILAATEKAKDHFDAVFLFGDLNFRIFGLKYESIVETLCQNNITPLLEHDQLSYIFRRKDTLPPFLEPFHEAAAITFRPTYKYDLGRDSFDSSSKQRAPAYTDRIIYKNKILPNGSANVFCIAYDGVFNLRVSDHRPVYGVFSIELKPGFDTLRLSGARFKRDLYVRAIQNQAKYLLERRKKLASSICVVC